MAKLFTIRQLMTVVLSLTIVSFSYGAKEKGENIPFKKKYFKKQKKEFREALKMLQKGNAYYYYGIHSKALDYFLKVQELNPNNSELNAKVGDCYLYSSQKYKAQKHLYKAYTLDKEMDGYFYYRLGRAYHINHKFDHAIKFYSLSKDQKTKITPKEPMDPEKRIMECKYGKVMVKDSSNVGLENMGVSINSEHQEYVPLINADRSEMYFTSRRPNTTGGNIDEKIDDYYEDIYFSEMKDEKWSPAENVAHPTNSEFHDATVGLSIDGQKLFLYRDDNKGDGNLYMSKKQGKLWLKPEKLPEPINSRYTETSACFDYKESTIFFVSDRPDGEGGMDIYKSTKLKNGAWGPAENLGPTINTKYDEDAVFLHADGKTLYFSSKGHNSMGGFDVFKTVLEEGKWTNPENLKYPVNSADDDVCIVLTANGENGYYSTSRHKSEGKKDIYQITFYDQIAYNKKPKLTLLKGKIFNKTTGAPVGAKIEIFDLDKNEVVATYESNSYTGKYMVSLPSGHDYGISVKAKGYLFHSENVNIKKSTEFKEMIKNIGMKPLEVGTKVELKNIFYEYNKASLSEKSYFELNKVVELMKKNPTMVIELSSHSDSRGKDSYNLSLSQRRAQSCVDYLLTKGIPKSSMVPKGYGEKKPIYSDSYINKLKTEKAKEEAHQRNRRTEFKILKNK